MDSVVGNCEHNFRIASYPQ
jgi:hypothetical protein